GHEQHRLGGRRNIVHLTEQDGTKGVAERRAAWVAAGDDIMPLAAEPIGQESALRRFASAVQAVEGDEPAGHGVPHSSAATDRVPRSCCGRSSSLGQTSRSASQPVAGAPTSKVASPTLTSKSRSPSYTR